MPWSAFSVSDFSPSGKGQRRTGAKKDIVVAMVLDTLLRALLRLCGLKVYTTLERLLRDRDSETEHTGTNRRTPLRTLAISYTTPEST